MRVSEKEMDEALEILWTLEEEDIGQEEFKDRFKGKGGTPRHKGRFRKRYRNQMEDKVISELRKKGYIQENELELTNKGEEAARNIVRRHRLAERLMFDVLSMTEDEIERPACEWEHLLSEGVADRICTLLGHPDECPHGMPIPKGNCCSTEKESLAPAVKPLNKTKVGEKVEVAYVRTEQHDRLNKLLSYDIGPGSKIILHQKNPAYIVKINESDIALEEKVAKDIYVKPI
ncbi:transcriptional regulator [archaeon SCG-AAA382B04]|nr:transcriptional regulator [archaeon SCG-AAA382B04]